MVVVVWSCGRMVVWRSIVLLGGGGTGGKLVDDGVGHDLQALACSDKVCNVHVVEVVVYTCTAERAARVAARVVLS